MTGRSSRRTCDGDWVNQRSRQFGSFTPVGSKGCCSCCTHGVPNILRGLETGRDAWVYNYSRPGVEQNIGDLVAYHDEIVSEFLSFCRRNDVSRPRDYVEKFLDPDNGPWSNPERISWTRSARGYLAKGERVGIRPSGQNVGTYRPFSRQHVYVDRHLNHERSQLPKIFPTSAQSNIGFYCAGMASAVPFSVLMLDDIPNLHVTGAGSGGQFFPRYTYYSSRDRDLHSDDLGGKTGTPGR
ncbi:MAG: type ISP restriction/modification enzyme [Nocardioidaceae bacterium]